MRHEIGYLKKVYTLQYSIELDIFGRYNLICSQLNSDLNAHVQLYFEVIATSSTCTFTGTCKYPDMVLKFRFKFDAGTKFSTKFSTCTLCVCVAVKSLQCPKFRSRCLYQYLQVNVESTSTWYHYQFIIVHITTNTSNLSLDRIILNLDLTSTAVDLNLVARRRKLHPDLAIFGNPTVYF